MQAGAELLRQRVMHGPGTGNPRLARKTFGAHRHAVMRLPGRQTMPPRMVGMFSALIDDLKTYGLETIGENLLDAVPSCRHLYLHMRANPARIASKKAPRMLLIQGKRAH